MKILIVDDEAEILNMLRRHLEMDGYDVTVTTSPHEAIKLMKQELFPLVLSDIKMPGMSGIDILREVKKINPLTNVLIMT
ncbi:MAG: response regulator, partial [Deltaproteobacteria bacterium]|nr:response regulator [Deltaproteobacteria bacterium]